MSSSASRSPDPIDTAIRDDAARWIVCRDRGFSPGESREYQRWLDADPRHAAALARGELAWSMLDRMPARVIQLHRPDALRARRRPRWQWPALGGLAAAAAVAFVYLGGGGAGNVGQPEIAAALAPAATPRTTLLADGTVVRLNVGAELAPQFTAAERRVRLLRGEAYFTVTSDAVRPFIVQAGEVSVRAVGTAFNVNLQSQAVDVIVTEGKVQVDAYAANPPPSRFAAVATHSEPAGNSAAVPTSVAPAATPLGAGQRAFVPRVAPAIGLAVVVSDVTPAEMARALAWRDALVRLGGAKLAELAQRFERQTGQRIVFADPELGDLRVGGRFPGHDVEGFVRVLEENYGIRSERTADGAFVLRKAP